MVTDGGYIYGADYFIMYINVVSLCCTPKTKTLWYVKYTAIRNYIIWLKSYKILVKKEKPSCELYKAFLRKVLLHESEESEDYFTQLVICSAQ